MLRYSSLGRREGVPISIYTPQYSVQGARCKQNHINIRAQTARSFRASSLSGIALCGRRRPSTCSPIPSYSPPPPRAIYPDNPVPGSQHPSLRPKPRHHLGSHLRHLTPRCVPDCPRRSSSPMLRGLSCVSPALRTLWRPSVRTSTCMSHAVLLNTLEPRWRHILFDQSALTVGVNFSHGLRSLPCRWMRSAG